MARTAYIARTAHDLTHVNRIGIPEFGIRDLRVAVAAKTGRFFQPEGAPAPTTAEAGAADFHFVPEHEDAEIRYEIDDRFAAIDGGKLELFTRFEANPLWTLDLKVLGPDWWAHGKHVVKWAGKIVKPTAVQAGTAKDYGFDHDLTALAVDKTIPAFPDGYTTLEHTPYKLRLTVTSTDWPAAANPYYAWTHFQILLKELELELGPEEAIPAAAVDDAEHKRNKATRTKMVADGGVPADGSTRKVVLISNIYKTAGAEMDNNTAFSEFKSMWGDGPQIPVIAKVRLAASDDTAVKIDETDKGAVALGKVKFLWDWSDPDEDVAGTQTEAIPKAFITDSIDYRKAKTVPKGDNCHLDRGGKRGDGAPPMFPPQTGYDPKPALDAGKFPFKVEASKNRKWAALSQGWNSGKLKGTTGVVFRPSRMGGDDYILTVYLAYEKIDKEKLKLDVKDDPLVSATVLKKKSGKFQMWRELHLVRYYRKKNAIADFVAGNLASVQSHYNEAYVAMEDKIQPADKIEVPSAGYNASAAGKLAAAGDSIVTFGSDPAADHSSTEAEFLMRDHAAFRAAIRADFVTNNPTASAVNIDAATDTWMTNQGVDTPEDYANQLNSLLNAPGKAVIKDLNTLNGAPDGITIIHFNFLNSVRLALDGNAGLSTLNGSAIDVPGNSRNKCCFAFWAARVDTFVHEIGHHLFLPHFGPKPDSFTASHHDKDDLQCIMSYNRPRPKFCGLCQLRLRGWDQTKIKTDKSKNKKT
jgi:hypothetical protein